jgi:hypothetical protein
MKPRRYQLVVIFWMLFFFHASATVLYVNVNNSSPASPYADWSTAATDIQSAIDAASVGDQILVTNGIYQTGGRAVTGSLLNRVVVSKALTLQSVNGPAVTFIQGDQVPGTIIDDGATRCVYLTNSATLIGFTLTNGATRGMSGTSSERYGGGIYCRSASAMVSNCIITGNAALIYGGGAYQGTFYNCTLIGNTATNGGGTYSSALSNCLVLNNKAYTYGGGAYGGSLSYCVVGGNTASEYGGGVYSSSLTGCTIATNYSSSYGGGAYSSSLTNCAIWGNQATNGGGAYWGILVNCTLVNNSAINGGGTYQATLYNSILYYNQASSYSNYGGGTLNYCCTVPLPGGSGNITNNPQLTDSAHISSNSPCRGVGNSVYAAATDIDGEPWRNPPSIGCDEYYTNGIFGDFTLAVNGNTYTSTGFPITYSGTIGGHARNYLWDFGDGTLVSNTFLPTHSWTNADNYSVTLTAYNDTHPSGTQFTLPVLVVTQLLYYVKPINTNPQPPYLSWATAATNIQMAVNIALPATGATVLVTNGTYPPVLVTSPLLISSINGQQQTLINGNNASRCVYLGTGANLNGFTLTGGYIYGGSGAGVQCSSISNIVSNCIIINNYASSAYGGGAYGGTLVNCSVLKNKGVSGVGFSPGGGAYGCLLSNCLISLNSSDASGGGVDSCTLFNCTLSSNSCTGSFVPQGVGGGANGSTLFNCLIFSNSANVYGGGAHSSTLMSCIVSNNTPSGVGYSTLTNCLIWGNQGSHGGLEVCSAYSSTIVSNSIFQGYGGAGVYNSTLNNCILYYNNGSTNDVYSTLNYCCTPTLPQNGINNFTSPPLFVNLATGNFHLQSNSPCINSGANFYVGVSQDFDGNPRIRGGTVDIGAYEFQNPSSVISYAWLQQYGLTNNGTADYADADGDGFKNWNEWRAGTSPTDSSSLLKMTTVTNNGSGMTVTWQSVNTRTYYLQRSTNLMVQPPFSTIQTDIAGQAGTTSYADTTATNGGPYFYRVGVQ